jgi:hypothetical protein
MRIQISAAITSTDPEQSKRTIHSVGTELVDVMMRLQELVAPIIIRGAKDRNYNVHLSTTAKHAAFITDKCLNAFRRYIFSQCQTRGLLLENLNVKIESDGSPSKKKVLEKGVPGSAKKPASTSAHRGVPKRIKLFKF